MFKRIACCAAAAMLLATAAAWAEDPYANIWTEQFGSTSSDYAYGLAVDGSGCSYTVGKTNGSIGSGSGNLFVAKHDEDGLLLWAQQYNVGQPESLFTGIDVYGDDVYVTGVDNNYAAYVTKLDASTGAMDTGFGTSGVLTFSSGEGDLGTSVAIAGSNSIYVAGQTWGSLFGPMSGEWYPTDAYLAKIDSSGNVTWGVRKWHKRRRVLRVRKRRRRRVRLWRDARRPERSNQPRWLVRWLRHESKFQRIDGMDDVGWRER